MKGILHVSQGYLGGLNLFRKTGFWTVNTQDFNFELSLAGNEEDGVVLQNMVDGQIRAGRFAYALRQGTPVFFLLGNESDPERGVLHSLAISSQVMGMFCGLLRREVAPAQEVAFSLLSTLLGVSADALATLQAAPANSPARLRPCKSLLPVCAWRAKKSATTAATGIRSRNTLLPTPRQKSPTASVPSARRNVAPGDDSN